MDELTTIAGKWYPNQEHHAFLHWSMSCLLADRNVTDEEIIEHIGMDGSRDLGIDGYWIDEENGQLILFQSKYSASQSGRIARKESQEFRSAVLNLADQEYVSQHGNQVLREAYPDIQAAILDNDYSIWLVLVTNKRIAKAASQYANGEGSAPWSFAQLENEYRKDIMFQILDSTMLQDLREEVTAAANPDPQLQLQIPKGMYHDVPGEFKAAQGIFYAEELAEAFRSHRSNIFRENIRGPLGSNLVNKEIVRSLQESMWAHNFHVLNNGITVLCESFRFDPEQQLLHVDNFQIVNGCQTTYTLYSLRDYLDEKVWVKFSIIEGMQWAQYIAKTTNSQSRTKSEDFLTVDPIQQTLKKRFDDLSPPWLYETKRGESRLRSAAEGRRYKTRYQERVLTMREVAQDSLAFLGQPTLAKWDLRKVFDRLEEEAKRLNEQIFSEDISAEQLLLATVLARRVKQRTKEVIKQERSDAPRARDNSPRRGEWLSYANTHLIGLVSEWLRIKENISSSKEGRFLDLQSSHNRRLSIGDWFNEAFDAALEAVAYRIDVTVDASGPISSLRNFFRDMDNYHRMVSRLHRRVE